MNIFEQFLLKQQNVYVVDSSIQYCDYSKIDLSENNVELNDISDDAIVFEHYIASFLEKNNAIIAFGGYFEKRNLYKRSTIFDNNIDNRNIHIGLDLWTKKNTKILAALDGIVFSVVNNEGLGNYGPTVILEHNLENFKFWTLYGHLSLSSITNLQIGKFIEKGGQIATLGNNVENGNYAPHLHFQIIKNITNATGDYPGVCASKDVAFYKSNCPDPNLLLKII